MRPDVLLGAARRFAVLLASISAAVVVVGLGLGALVGSAPNRSVSLGFYAAGAFLVLGGFVSGNRGPYRSADDGGALWRGRSLRRASADDVRTSINMSVLLVVLGLVLLALGVAVDSRYRLV